MGKSTTFLWSFSIANCWHNQRVPTPAAAQSAESATFLRSRWMISVNCLVGGHSRDLALSWNGIFHLKCPFVVWETWWSTMKFAGILAYPQRNPGRFFPKQLLSWMGFSVLARNGLCSLMICWLLLVPAGVPVLVSLLLSSFFPQERGSVPSWFAGSSWFRLGFRCLSPFFSLLSFLNRSVPDSSRNIELHMTLVETCVVAVWGLCWCNFSGGWKTGAILVDKSHPAGRTKMDGSMEKPVEIARCW